MISTTGDSTGLRIGTAGWGLPRQWRDQFPAEGSYLERYAARFSAAEINSSFYRQHRRAVYERWAAAVPASFRFAVKLPRAVTHDQRLVAVDVLLEVFLEEATGLGGRLGPILVQLPPSLAFDAELVEEFFAVLRRLHPGAVACEPRHESWFSGPAEAMLRRHGVARVAADPARVPAAAEPGGDARLAYVRLHGSPRMYYSNYEPERLAVIAEGLRSASAAGAETWCILDNTTLGAATGNALALSRMTAGAPAGTAGARPARSTFSGLNDCGGLMSNRSIGVVVAAAIGASLACSSGGDDRPRAESASVVQTPAAESAPASAGGGADSLGEGDVRIVTRNGGIDLALIGDSISSGLSPEALRTVRQETDTASVSGTGLGAQIEKAVKGTVQGAIGKRVAFPISEVREVRYDGEKLVFEWVGEPRKLFENTKLDGKPLLASFAAEDARRFAAAVNARKGKPRHL